jgi:UDP-N-acetylglucosamine 2-epimerase (non-hydrolysing)
MKKILVVIGTRPNFIKVTRFRKVAQQYPGIELKIVHTGQHYDEKMADVFFSQFRMTPDFFLNIPAGNPEEQKMEIMQRLEKLILEFKPDLLVVPGDVNSTLAAALTAKKLGIKLAHIESGLRSFDDTMPEEYNRIVTDELSDLLFVTEQSGLDNLNKEKKPAERIHFVGNTMIDTIVEYAADIENSGILEKLSIEKKKFVLMTMHRPATVDSEDGLKKLVQLIRDVAKEFSIVFPIHPRTVKNLERFGLLDDFKSVEGLKLTEPLDYFSFQKLISNCAFILTDSGGIQEESTFLQVPCLTLRPNTERPITITLGTNELLPFELALINGKINEITSGKYKKGTIPPLWDGRSTERIMEIISKAV